jgi:hypothetical protein
VIKTTTMFLAFLFGAYITTLGMPLLQMIIVAFLGGWGIGAIGAIVETILQRTDDR